MRSSIQLLNILAAIGVFVWFYAITFIQLTNPFNTLVTGISCLFYTLLYLGIRKQLLVGEIREFILIGAFTITFTAFWANIVHLIFFTAELNAGKDPRFMLLNSLIYALLFLLFYKSMEPTKRQIQSEANIQKTVQFILEVAFPIMAAICTFVVTLLLYAILLQVRVETLIENSTGVNPLIAIIAITIVVTVIVTYLFEKWLATIDKQTMEVVLFGITVAGGILTIFLARTGLH